MIIDTHVHLDLPQFDHDRDEVIRRAREAGVEMMLCIGMAHPAKDSLRRTLALAESCDFLYATVGVHPHDAREANVAFLLELEAAAKHPKVLLWGEIGLDYHYKNSPKEAQCEAFRRQLDAARRSGLPVVIHCREAWDDLFRIMEAEAGRKKTRGILHNFTGSAEQARRCSEMGLLISFSGIVSFHSSGELRSVARSLRLDQILVESDAPYVAPAHHRGLRNEPAYVVDVAESLAGIIDVTFDDIARNSSRNFRRLVGMQQDKNTDVLVYTIRDRLYINLTNECTARCVFCQRETSPVASGYDLHLDREHTPREYLEAVGDPSAYEEIIFCGFGEPTLRLEELITIGRSLKARGARLRLNTNGHGNLIHGRDIAPDLATFLDEISISIDAANAATYGKIVRPDFGDEAFGAVIDFIRACKGKIPRIVVTAVALPSLDLQPIQELVQGLGVDFRAREYQPMVGSTDFTKNLS
jgi:TatD DNase family protein